jgi:peroxiredoxin
LAAFEAAREALEEEGITVVAGSAQPPVHAAALVERLGVTFPVMCSLPVRPTAAAVGGFFDPRLGIVHATGLVVRPQGVIAAACTSTGPLGRLEPEEVLGAVRFWKGAG